MKYSEIFHFQSKPTAGTGTGCVSRWTFAYPVGWSGAHFVINSTIALSCPRTANGDGARTVHHVCHHCQAKRQRKNKNKINQKKKNKTK
jgi:hypothetical protein